MKNSKKGFNFSWVGRGDASLEQLPRKKCMYCILLFLRVFRVRFTFFFSLLHFYLTFFSPSPAFFFGGLDPHIYFCFIFYLFRNNVSSRLLFVVVVLGSFTRSHFFCAGRNLSSPPPSPDSDPPLVWRMKTTTKKMGDKKRWWFFFFVYLPPLQPVNLFFLQL